MGKSTHADIQLDADENLPPVIITEHPITKEPILLRDPALTVVPHKQNTVTCATAESFAAAVKALVGPNRLVELRGKGEFYYRDSLGAQTINSVRFALRPAPTAVVLGLDGCFVCSQAELLRWKDQWPETLGPLDDVPGAIWEMLAAYDVKEVKEVKGELTDSSISVGVSRRREEASNRLPRFWTGRSALYEGHATQEVTLCLDVETPDVDRDGAVTGKISFSFSLWAPAKGEVIAAAMQDVLVSMEAALPEFTIIQGEIA